MSATDDQFADRLAAIDEALSGGDLAPGDGTPTEHGDATPPDLRLRLVRGVAALRDLQRLRPPRAITGPTAPARIGRFSIVRELGRGGFGVVVLAHDPKLHREVALKVPHAHALLDAGLRDRFRREALAAAGLDHPNVVSVYEVDDAGPVCFIASAYCPGPTLCEWLSRGPTVTATEAATFLAVLADAVAHAHARGVIHRDLKPANILLTPPAAVSADVSGRRLGDFVPKVADFGLARLAAEPDRVTRTGGRLGTPAYMAPEQAAGARDVGPPADQYALGVILYELLVGRPPFRGENDVDTLRQVADSEPVAPRRLRPGLLRDLDTICLKCLEKSSARRYDSVGDLAEDLRRFVAGRPISARRVGPVGRAARWCRRKPVVAGLSAALVLVAAVAGAAVYRQSQRAEQERDAAIVERDRARRLLEQAHTALGRLHDLGEDQHSLAHIFGAVGPDVARRPTSELLAELADGPPADRHYRLVAALDQARLNMGSDGWETAVNSMHSIVAVQRAALAARPHDRELIQDLAMALEWLGAACFDGEQWGDAEKHCREAVDLRRRLLESGPGGVGDRIALARGWSRLGNTLMSAGRWAAAEAPYAEASRAFDRVIADAPNDSIAHHDYAKHLLDVWRLYDRLRRYPARAENFRKLVAVRAQLVRLQPGSARRRTELAWAHFHLSLQSCDLGDWATADEHLAAVRRMLAARVPADQAAEMRRLAYQVNFLGRRLAQARPTPRPVKQLLDSVDRLARRVGLPALHVGLAVLGMPLGLGPVR